MLILRQTAEVLLLDCVIREWRIDDKYDLAKVLNNKRILDNLRDGLPYPYTEKDAEDYINYVLSADKSKTSGRCVNMFLKTLI